MTVCYFSYVDNGCNHRPVTYTSCTTYNPSPSDHATTLHNHTFYTPAHTNWFVLPPPIATISANPLLKTYHCRRPQPLTPLLSDEWQYRRSTANEVQIIHQDVLFFQFLYTPGSICKLISLMTIATTPSLLTIPSLQQRFHCWRYFHCWWHTLPKMPNA